MKITGIILVILFSNLLLPAQQLEVINTCGGEVAFGTTGGAFSIGEPITLTSAGSETLLTQGFLQPEQGGWVETIDIAGQMWAFVVFPNPTTDYLFLKSETGAPVAVNIRLYDSAGRLILTDQLAKGDTNLILNLNNFAAGYYCLSLTDENGGVNASSGIVKK